MNDEGVTTYFEEINQMTHGAAFLQKELGFVFQTDITGCSTNLNPMQSAFEIRLAH